MFLMGITLCNTGLWNDKLYQQGSITTCGDICDDKELVGYKVKFS